MSEHKLESKEETKANKQEKTAKEASRLEINKNLRERIKLNLKLTISILAKNIVRHLKLKKHIPIC